MSDAIAEPTRRAGLNRLSEFAGRAGPQYAKSRNFDFGPRRRGNVSMLSPYVRHRLVLEQELLESALRRHSLSGANKFVQEVFWRTYFKGWLEQHPQVWSDYRSSLSELLCRLDTDAELLDRYSVAVAGRTGIECFDAWIGELLKYGYLHNHARMWFASIWVFTLRLPWQLGADLFYRHLIDGDPASNTLGWRWVCGLHTRGRHYLARESNIANYTDNRFRASHRLATDAPPLTETRMFPLRALRAPQVLGHNERFGLLITEEDGCPESLLNDQVPVSIMGAVATRMRSPLPIGSAAAEFAYGAVADAVDRATRVFGVDGQLSSSADLGTTLVDWALRNNLNAIATAYAPVGPVDEMLSNAAKKLEQHRIRLLQLRRPYDSLTWPYARHGYFKLKKQIPALLERLDIPQSRQEFGREA